MLGTHVYKMTPTAFDYHSISYGAHAQCAPFDTVRITSIRQTNRHFSVKLANNREEGVIYRSEKLTSSHPTYITRYERQVPVNIQENTTEPHRYGGAGWLVWRGITLVCGSRTDLHVQSVTMTGNIYRDVILEQHVRLFRGAMGAEFLFMDDQARNHRANIVDECLQSEDITRMDWPAYSPDLNPIEQCGICMTDDLQPFNPLSPVYRNFI
ncbi:DDE_3 domain-containing protein [Trichonephila clavipes]|nr:DDE_3 domain-containing protein [Trichonephila clavipes]